MAPAKYRFERNFVRPLLEVFRTAHYRVFNDIMAIGRFGRNCVSTATSSFDILHNHGSRQEGLSAPLGHNFDIRTEFNAILKWLPMPLVAVKVT